MSSGDDFDDYNDYDYPDEPSYADSRDYADHPEDSENSDVSADSDDLGIYEGPEYFGDFENSVDTETTEVLGESGDLSGSNESNDFELKMPTDNFDNEFMYRGSGANKDTLTGAVDTLAHQPRTRTLTIIPTSRDGSYYYSNPDGSKHYNTGKGESWYQPPAPTESSNKSSSK
ncbi:hypothetical protein N7478_012152 [Penicillium angulare]|uniref:uncharacterized protein n=1 Tax=Penicillium angulare TaxID=116970 RepID=UPI002540F0BA|nr:uncharacterized protein N7478_012152 [Penicillium angulare]KAJ5260547.1 hypothetical protein N7478_012152 [Penicillium angulare]